MIGVNIYICIYIYTYIYIYPYTQRFCRKRFRGSCKNASRRIWEHLYFCFSSHKSMDIRKHRDTNDKSHGSTLKYHSPGLGAREKWRTLTNEQDISSQDGQMCTQLPWFHQELWQMTPGSLSSLGRQPGKNTVIVGAYLTGAELLLYPQSWHNTSRDVHSPYDRHHNDKAKQWGATGSESMKW